MRLGYNIHMPALFKKVDYTLQVLKDEIDQGVLGLPDIQRPFVWPNKKVRDLFDSLYKGFPVGYLLFWSSSDVGGTKHIGTGPKQRTPQRLIVDGQQRLTALYAVLTGSKVLDSDWVEREIQIAFKPSDGTFEVSDASTSRNPEFISNISTIWSPETSLRRMSSEFVTRLRESREVTNAEEDLIYDNIDKVRDILNYPFVAIEIGSDVDEQSVSDIFVRINSKGQRLNEADFILTLMSVFWEDGRKSLESFSRECIKPTTTNGPANSFINPSPDQMLRVVVAYAFRRARLRYVYLLLRGRDLESEKESPEVRDQQFALLQDAQFKALDLQNWKDFLKCVLKAGYRSEGMISSKTGLLYSYALFLIGRIDFKVEASLLESLIAKWFFMQALTGRYTGSPESKFENDLSKLRSISTPEDFVSVVDSLINEELTNDYWQISLPGHFDTSASHSPSLAAYHASLVLHKADVLFTENEPLEYSLSGSFDSRRSDVERHHIFPKAHLAKLGITDIISTNTIANMIYIRWEDNMTISDRAPLEYWPELETKYLLNPAKREIQMKQNALPEGWHTMPYREFLAERRRLIALQIRDAFKKI